MKTLRLAEVLLGAAYGMGLGAVAGCAACGCVAARGAAHHSRPAGNGWPIAGRQSRPFDDVQ